MSSNHLKNPPLITTDLPTNDFFVTHDLIPASLDNTFYHYRANQLAHQHDRYSNTAGDIAAIAMVPNGFSDAKFANGVIAIYNTRRVDGTARLHVAFHEATDVRGYGTGWTVSNLLVDDPSWQFASYYYRWECSAVLGAQRLGNRVYAFTGYDTVNSGYDIGSFGIATATSLLRIDSTSSVTTLTSSLVGGYSTYYPPNLYSIAGASAEMFVSDDEYPFVWLRERWSDGQEYVTGFWDNPAAFPANHQTPIPPNLYATAFNPFLGIRGNGSPSFSYPNQEGQLGAYRQLIAQPTGWQASRLVFPWSAGDYGPPELWHVIRTGTTFTIYRSKWLPGAWQLPTGWVFFDGQLTNRRFPLYNPHGYGFEPNWHNDAHKIGTFKVPQLSPSTPISLHILRDHTNPGVLHMPVIADVAEPVQIWSGISGDDGENWAFTQTRRAVSGATTLGASSNFGHVTLTGASSNATRAVRITDDNTLVAVVDNWNNQQYRVGLIAADPAGSTTADPEAKNVIFKRGENRGASAWL